MTDSGLTGIPPVNDAGDYRVERPVLTPAASDELHQVHKRLTNIEGRLSLIEQALANLKTAAKDYHDAAANGRLAIFDVCREIRGTVKGTLNQVKKARTNPHVPK